MHNATLTAPACSVERCKLQSRLLHAKPDLNRRSRLNGGQPLGLGTGRKVGRRRQGLLVSATSDEQQGSSEQQNEPEDDDIKEGEVESMVDLKREIEAGQKNTSRKADSTDAVASFLTRRFGIGAGLAWLGILAVGAIGEQIKTRIEFRNEQESARDVQDERQIALPSGVSYIDKKIGGGSTPQTGFLTVVELTGKADGVTFVDTRATRKAFVFFFGARPYSGGICAGVEEAMQSMKVGGKRTVTVPPELGFGNKGGVLFPDETEPSQQGRVPPGATLVYDVELKRVSIPPS